MNVLSLVYFRLYARELSTLSGSQGVFVLLPSHMFLYCPVAAIEGMM